MSFQSHLWKVFTLSAVASLSTTAFAFERDHSAHEHGHAKLSVVLEGNELLLNFESPAIDIVGFEHKPKNHDQEDKVAAAEKTLKDGEALFELSAAAGCALEHAKVSSSLLEPAKKKHDHHDHDDEYGDDDHHHHDHHKHGHESEEESHSEFAVEYHFECKDSSKLTGVGVRLLSSFPSIKELEAQVVGPKGQSLQELSAKNTQVAL